MGTHRVWISLMLTSLRLSATLLLLLLLQQCTYATGTLVFESAVLVGSDTKA